MVYSTLDIVLPCYNPPPGWEQKVIETFKFFCKALPEVQTGLIIINDGSSTDLTDAIAAIKKAVPFFILDSHSPNKGKGFTLRSGVAKSTAEICIYIDIDFPYTNESMLSIWKILASENSDIAVGIKNAHYFTHVPPVRKYISKLLQKMIRVFFGLTISDTQCGLKGFNEKGKAIFLQTTINRYLFDLEFIYLASKNTQIQLSEIEIQLRPDIHFRDMNLRILFTESINFLKIVLRRIF
ncbi:MAG TPA: glycosyltransferase family 2 protein [Chitinophagales bacterium]|nr:glycosyltransferase family 2 protein [Chitinophagales bacterium]